MTLGQSIYKLIIGPLELLFETVFVVANRKVSNPALAIIALSIAMNFLVLPLYKRADALQEEERIREQRMRPWIDHIKKTFKGDERFMMLQTYYRQNNYKPTDSLKGSISLLLEIPFFIAAYRFLSSLELLKGVSFGPITDLGAPDAMISVGGAQINVLPILMTIINLIAASIYMKGLPLKNKVQMFGVAGIFLILLYRSPAGLVFYWTLNNLFSLFKNIIFKISDSKNKEKKIKKGSIASFNFITQKQTNSIFVSATSALALLTGLLIPSAVIADSTEEFINLTDYVSPNLYILSSFLLAVGTFIIWCGVFYILTNDTGKKVLGLLASAGVALALIDYMIFGKDYGNLSSNLQYDEKLSVYKSIILQNLAFLIVMIIVVAILWRYKNDLLGIMIVISCIAFITMSTMNLFQINKVLKADKKIIETAMEDVPEFTFSKKGKNVVVIMMDRQMGEAIPFLIAEKKELKNQFDGFVYYSNAISNSNTTNEGAPPIYGGYDYIPAEMNARKSESLAEKNDEALKVLPELFSSEGFSVTICDPTYAGYKWIPDLTIFEDHPEYKTYILNGRYSMEEYGYISSSDLTNKARFRNFFCYSIFKISPVALHKTLYEYGNYNSSMQSNSSSQTIEGDSKARGYKPSFMKNFATLYNLPRISTIKDDSSNNYIVMSNDTTHEEALLKEPEYEPAMEIDNTEYDKENPIRIDDDGNIMEFDDLYHRKLYQSNMAAMLVLGKWLDYLKENGVYDNTRIIIVSDHGAATKSNERYKYHYIDEDTGEDKFIDIRHFACALLYKDFNAKGFKTDNSFASNADTPWLALKDIVDNPTNPFTGNTIRRFNQDDLPWEIARTANYNIDENNGNVFLRSNWFEVNPDIHSIENWRYIGNK